MASRLSRPQKPPLVAKTTAALPVLHPYAAGIDVGATEFRVAVPADANPELVRAFDTFSEDREALAGWLKTCGIRTVAMKSTGVYWIPLFQLLETRGFEVYLVNARHVKNVPGRKSDVADCQWLRYLHAVGLLRGSFRPPDAVCAVRSLQWHRETLVQYAARGWQHMQKALSQTNVQLHHVISDLTGKAGPTIVEAMLRGERDPQQLATLRDPRIKASEATMAQALVGDWREEHLFALRQSLAAYRAYETLLRECDAEIERLLQAFESTVAPDQSLLPPAKPGQDRVQGQGVRLPHTDLRTELYRLLGVDLTQVPGLQATTVHCLFAELGPDLSAFPSAKHFASWLGLCSDNRISGGKIISVKTRSVRSRVATALRLAAQSLHHSQSALGEFYQRMRAKLGAPKAITATAHKLARIIYRLLTTKVAYDESVFAQGEARCQQRRLQRLQRDATQLGYTLTPR
jgi:transposase